MTIFLAGDVGGTKCELALFDSADPDLIPIEKKRFPSREYADFSAVIGEFLQGCDCQPVFAGFGVAGPVDNGIASITNLPWRISESALVKEFNFGKVILVNDLTAVCASLSVMKDSELVLLHEGRSRGDMKGVVAPGTGLGEGYLIDNQQVFLPRGSEGGHTNFAPTNELQLHLLNWALKKRQPVSYEDLIAGPGIALLYDFFVEEMNLSPKGEIVEAVNNVVDRTPVIVEGALSADPCPLCKQVVNLFLEILGSEAGNLGLKLYATAGVYIGGGILPRLIDRVDVSGLINAYLDKGKMKELISSMPLSVIVKNDAALIGVACCCVRAAG